MALAFTQEIVQIVGVDASVRIPWYRHARNAAVADAIYVAVSLLCFLLAWGYTLGCERL